MVLVSDEELLRATAAGNGSAFGDLVGRHSQQLFRLAFWMLKNRADAEDLVQETLAGAFRGAGRFDGRATVKTWLSAILVRQASKFRYRNRRHAKTASLDAYNEPGGFEPAMRIASSDVAVDRRLDLAEMIDMLPEDQRMVVVLRESQGLSYDEIAGALSIPRGTVESRLHRARAALRARLGGYMLEGARQ